VDDELGTIVTVRRPNFICPPIIRKGLHAMRPLLLDIQLGESVRTKKTARLLVKTRGNFKFDQSAAATNV
jgi:hypothetical protein